MNLLSLIRNNWKKSAFAAVVSGYGIITLKTHLQITNYMRQICYDVAASDNVAGSAPRKVLVVVNPVANKKKAEDTFKKYCEPILHLAGYSVEILRTSYVGHAKTFIEDMRTLPDAIVVAGGDGTTSEVVTGLMRRQGSLCPIALIPLGRTSRQSDSKYFSLSGGKEVDYVRALASALMPLLKNKFKYESVIQYDVLNDDSEEYPKKLKPIFGLKRFSWGVMKDIDASKDKYWYFGSLRHYAAAFVKSLSNTLNWNFETDYIYTPSCPGCTNCYVPRQGTSSPSGFFLRKLVASKSNAESPKKDKIIRNDSCSNTIQGRIETNQLNIACSQNEENFTELESKFINSLHPGWDFIKNIPNITSNAIAPSLVLKSRTIQLYPTADTSNIFYYIDGEEYDARPIKVSIVPNAIKVFC